MRTVILRGVDRKGGFTLIELMIVIAISGVLAVLAGPSMEAWIARMRLKSATMGVEGTITAVRKMAMSENIRYCVSFGTDAAYAGNGPGYNIVVTTEVETALNTGIWSAATSPEIASWTNSTATELYKGVSLESTSGTTTALTGLDGCGGLLFNNLGYLDNPVTDFTVDCNGMAGTGASCARLTLRQKYTGEQRSLWVDRGGGVRISQSPNAEPAPPS